MPKLYLQNIANAGRTIYLFERLPDGQLKTTSEFDFYPYYYELSDKGSYLTYEGKLAKQMILTNPSDVAKQRSQNSYESDILYPKRYLIDNVEEILKSPTKYLFLDIEILCNEFPDETVAKFPISCVTIYNSQIDGYMTWYLPEWHDEEEMITDLLYYIRTEQPDILLAWNIEFDYTYLYNRYDKVLKTGMNFAERISPISKSRMGKNGAFYPAGISIVDYMGLYEKITLRKKRSYALDYVCQDELKEEAWGITDFSEASSNVKEKNMNDVRRMVSLEEKNKLIPHFDEIRRFSKCYWEDLPNEHIRREGKLTVVSNNSKVIDMLVLQEAKEMGRVLPKKQADQEKEEFEGAYRDTLKTGKFRNIGKYDLSGAYMKPITDLCLDTANIVDEIAYMNNPKTVVAVTVTDRKTKDVKETYFIKQNANALLPRVIRKLTTERNKYRSLMKSTSENAPEYEDIEQKYKAFKSLALSAYGVIAMQYFRLYDNRIASMITSTVRDLLHYVEEETERLGFPVIYVDTDSVFVDDGGINISNRLNELIQKWSQSRFNIPSTISFEYEGHFDKILILKKCRYYGYMKGRIKPEIKGLETKRSSSSKYEAKFQDELINKVLNDETKEQITDWLIKEQEEMHKVPIKNVAFPAKINNDNYESIPIFVRAYENSKKLFKLNVEKGGLFYYVYIKPIGKDMNGKDENVIAFTDDSHGFMVDNKINIDWDEMIRRNILGKVEVVFDVMGWGDGAQALAGQTTLF